MAMDSRVRTWFIIFILIINNLENHLHPNEHAIVIIIVIIVHDIIFMSIIINTIVIIITSIIITTIIMTTIIIPIITVTIPIIPLLSQGAGQNIDTAIYLRSIFRYEIRYAGTEYIYILYPLIFNFLHIF